MRFGIRELIFLIVLLAVPAVSLLYVFKPRNAEISEALEEIRVKQERLDKLAVMTSRIEDLATAIEDGREAIDAIERKLPSEDGVETILQQVWEIAGDHGLLLKSFKSDDPVPAAAYQEQPFDIEMEGNFEGFYRFLLDLEQLSRITRIHDLSLERMDSGLASTANAEMKAEFMLSIYYQPLTVASTSN